MIDSFDGFLESLGIPRACVLDKPVYKKMFLEASDGKKSTLDTADKKCLKGDVDKIRWLYTLKPSTINIAPFSDKEREYPEIAFLHISLLSEGKLKQVASFINRAIPYPLVLFFTCDNKGDEALSIALADKRPSQSDAEKWVVEDSWQSKWISFKNMPEAEQQFLADIAISNLPFINFYEFYLAIRNRMAALNIESRTGCYSVAQSKDTDKRLNTLTSIEQHEKAVQQLRYELKKEQQFNKRLAINVSIKEHQKKIRTLEEELSL